MKLKADQTWRMLATTTQSTIFCLPISDLKTRG